MTKLDDDSNINDFEIIEEYDFVEDFIGASTGIFFGIIRLCVKAFLWLNFGKFLYFCFGKEKFLYSYDLSTIIVSLLIWFCIFICPVVIARFGIVLNSDGKKLVSCFYTTFIMPLIIFSDLDLSIGLNITVYLIFYSFILIFYPEGTIIGFLGWSRLIFFIPLLIIFLIAFIFFLSIYIIN